MLFDFFLKHIIRTYVSYIWGKVVSYNCSLKTYRIFAIICFSKFNMYVRCWSRIVGMYTRLLLVLKRLSQNAGSWSWWCEYTKTAVRYAFNSKMFSIFRDLNSGPDFSVHLVSCNFWIYNLFIFFKITFRNVCWIAYETSSLQKWENSQCLSPLFVFYFWSNYDGPRTKVFIIPSKFDVAISELCRELGRVSNLN